MKDLIKQIDKKFDHKNDPNLNELNKNNIIGNKKMNESITTEIIQHINWAISAYMDGRNKDVKIERLIDELKDAADEYKVKPGDELILKFESSGLEISLYELINALESGHISEFINEFEEIANGESQVVPASDMKESKRINEGGYKRVLMQVQDIVEEAIIKWMDGVISVREFREKMLMAQEEFETETGKEFSSGMIRFEFTKTGLIYTINELIDAVEDNDTDLFDQFQMVFNAEQDLEPMVESTSAPTSTKFGGIKLADFDEFINEDRFSEIEDEIKQKGRGKSIADRGKDRDSNMRDMSRLKDRAKRPDFDQHRRYEKNRKMNTAPVSSDRNGMNEAENKEQSKDATTNLKEGHEKMKEEAVNYDQDEHPDHVTEKYMNEMASLNAGMMAETYESACNESRNEELTNEQYESACNEMKMAFDKKMDEMVESRQSHGTVQEAVTNSIVNYGLVEGSLAAKLSEAKQLTNKLEGDFAQELSENLNSLKNKVDTGLSKVDEALGFISEFDALQKRNLKIASNISGSIGKGLFDTLNSLSEDVMSAKQLARVGSNMLVNTGHEKGSQALKESKVNTKFKQLITPQLESSDKAKNSLIYAYFVDELKRNGQLKSTEKLNEINSSVLETNKRKRINEKSGDIDLSNDFALIQTGGSIGSSKGSYYIPAYSALPNGGTIVKTGNDKDDLKDEAKRRRKILSKTDKKYYGLGYKVVEISKSLKKSLETTGKVGESKLVKEWSDKVLPQIQEEESGKISSSKRKRSFRKFLESKINDGVVSERDVKDLELPNRYLKESGKKLNEEMEEEDVIDTFRNEILPDIEAEEQNGPDVPKRREAFNNFVDSLAKDGKIDSKMADELELPDELEED